jgi:hypothetical protein
MAADFTITDDTVLTGDATKAEEISKTAVNCTVDTSESGYVTYSYTSASLTLNSSGKLEKITGLSCNNINTSKFKFNSTESTISFETDGTFDISIVNPNKGITGLTLKKDNTGINLFEDDTNTKSVTLENCDAGNYTIGCTTGGVSYMETLTIKVKSNTTSTDGSVSFKTKFDVADVATGTYSANTLIGDNKFMLLATQSATAIVSDGLKDFELADTSIGSTKLTRAIQIKGSGAPVSGAIKFKTASGASGKVYVYCTSASSTDARILRLLDADGTELYREVLQPNESDVSKRCAVFEVEPNTTYYLASLSGGVNIFYIGSDIAFADLNTTISGSVTIDGKAASGYTVTLSNGETAVTDSNGNYSFNSTLYTGGSYTVAVDGNSYYSGANAAVEYKGDSVTVDTMELATKQYTVKFSTNIKDYKNYFFVLTKEYFEQNQSSIANLTYKNKNITFYWSDTTDGSNNATGEALRKFILNKETKLSAGDYVLVYMGTNFDVELDGTMLASGDNNAYLYNYFTVNEDSKHEVKFVPKALDLTGIKFPEVTLQNGTVDLTAIAKGNANESNTVVATNYGSVKNSANESIYGALTKVDGDYVSFIVPEGRYKVRITTSMQAACLYTADDNAKINDVANTAIAMDSNFGNYSLVLDGGKYVIKGAASSYTVIKNITVYTGSYVTLEKPVAGNEDNVIVALKFDGSLISGGFSLDDISGSDIGIAFASNSAYLSDPSTLNAKISSSSENVFYVTLGDNTLYKKVYYNDEKIFGIQSEYDNDLYHGFDVAYSEDDNLYAVAITKLNGAWNIGGEVYQLKQKSN